MKTTTLKAAFVDLESAQLDHKWTILSISPQLCLEIGTDHGAASALAEWSAVGSMDALITLMGSIRQGLPAITWPAADGRGTVVITTTRDEQGQLATSTWLRATHLGHNETAGDHQQLLDAIAATLSHDGIAPLRRSLAFLDTVLMPTAEGASALSPSLLHRIQRAHTGLSEGADIIRELVATIRSPSRSPPGQCRTADINQALSHLKDHATHQSADATQDQETVAPWTLDDDILLPIDASAVTPVFVSLATLAQAKRSEPTWTRVQNKWQLSIELAFSDRERQSLLRLAGTTVHYAGHITRPRLYLANKLVHLNGWSWSWNNATLQIAGTCLVDK